MYTDDILQLPAKSEHPRSLGPTSSSVYCMLPLALAAFACYRKHWHGAGFPFYQASQKPPRNHLQHQC